MKPNRTIRLTFLGTGTSQGVPVIGCDCAVCCSPDARDARLRTSAMVEVGDKRFIIDAGPDFRQQMLREGTTNAYTIEKRGVRKLIYQTPWYEEGKVAGLVEYSIVLPPDMPHKVRG